MPGERSNRVFQSPPHAGELFSAMLMVVTGVVLAVYWMIYAGNSDLAPIILRPPVVGAAMLFGLMWYRLPATRAERALIKLLCVEFLVLLLPTLLATDPGRAILVWFKSLLLAVVAVCFARALRNDLTSRWLGVTLLFSSVLLSVYIAAVFVAHMGFKIPTWEAMRVYKGVILKQDIPLNAVVMAALMSYISAACLLRWRGFVMWPTGAFVIVCTGVLTGSRAPLATLIAGAGTVWLLTKLRSPQFGVRVTSWCAVICVAVCIVVGLSLATFKQMSNITEGRWDLWSVAWKKFTEQPLFGYGFLSWRDDLASRLPGDYEFTLQIEQHDAGAYHSEYLSMLAEQGLAGTVPILAIFVFLFRRSYQLAYEDWVTWRNAGWALFGAISLLLRAGVEVPGLFGYAQEPADFLAFIFLAIVVSRHSREDDWWRVEGPAACMELFETESPGMAALAVEGR